MILRVLDTMEASSQIASIILCGPAQKFITQEPELQARIVV